jgi:membrane dipeptidase
MNVPVFDLHCDTALALLGTSLRECGSLKRNSYHIDLDRAQALNGYAQCFACFTSEASNESIKPVELFEREMVSVLREVEKHNDIIRLAYTGADVQKNYIDGYMSAILTIEGPAGFGYDPELLPDLYAVGFRMTTLGWNDANPLTGSHEIGGGITKLGRDFFKKAQSVGMIVDVSHISDEGFWDIIDITQAPIIASHSNSRAICDHSRNLTDEMFSKICECNGVAGINLYAEFLGNSANLDTVCDHIFHFLELDPDGKHIALGCDLDGCNRLPNGFGGVQDYPILAQKLQQRGLNEEIIRNIFWKNAIEVMDRCCT